MTLTDQFIDKIFSIQYEDISSVVKEKLKVCLIDSIGVTIAGANLLKEKGTNLISLLGGENVVCPIGFNKKTSLINAIFSNGLSSHVLELDDGVRYGVIHPSAPLFSVLIPLAKIHKVSWEKFVIGAICGYETSIRLAYAMQPYHYRAGFHPTATCCTIGVSVAIAIMLDYTRDEVKDAFSAASVSSYGTLKVLEDVSELKPYNCAKAVLNGYMSAMMAKAGFRGPNDALSGDTGFLQMMSSNWNEDILIGDRDYFYVEKVYLKPYASCRHTHPEIEAAFRIRKENGFDVKNIRSINVKTYKGVIGKHDSNDIYGESSARMSIPYSLAVALVTGKAGIAEFQAPYIEDPFILSLNKSIIIESDDELSQLVPDKRVAIVDIVLTNEQKYSCRVDYPKGEPENPLSNEELHEKFTSMALLGGKSEEWIESTFDYVMSNDEIKPYKLI